MKLSDYVIEFLAKEGIRHLFEMTGGAITHLLDSAHGRPDIECVSVHHEQAAAFAAEGYARMNGKLGVALATSGPGALNLLTGIGSCYFDSVPALFLTGQVNTYEYKFGKPIRQLGFQETDIVSIAKPITKWAHLVTEPELIRFDLEKAVSIARGGRPGPVLLDIPMNVQRAEVDPVQLTSYFDSPEFRSPSSPVAPIQFDSEAFRKMVELILQAERPLVLAGGGVRSAGAVPELRRFLRTTGIPSVASLMGLDSAPAPRERNYGLIGSYGHRYANLAVANCDLLLVLGSRLDTRQTGTKPDTFARGATIIHVDIDGEELGHKVIADLTIRGDVSSLLASLAREAETWQPRDYSAWIGTLDGYRNRFPTANPAAPGERNDIDPNRFMSLLSDFVEEKAVICLDVGQHQMWASQSLRLKDGQRLLNAGGMGAMGFALPASFGSAKAAPGLTPIVIAGDGGIQVNIQELDTVVRHNIPMKLFVMNNHSLGMVRQFQDMYLGGRQQSTVIGYGCPDLTKIAEAYGWKTFRIERWADAERAIAEIFACEGCVFAEVMLALGSTVNPKLTVNRPVEDMSPFLDREELQKLMLIDPLPQPNEPK